MQRTVILASSSLQKKRLLEQIGLAVRVIPSDYKELRNPRLKAKGQAEFSAKEKVKIVMEKNKDQDVVIIGLDTLIEYNEETLGIPRSETEVKAMLTKLSGTTHLVHTTFTICDVLNKKTMTQTVTVQVTLKKLTKRELDIYSKSKESLTHVGGYDVTHKGAVLLREITGDFHAIVGVPIHELYEALKEFGVYAI